MAKRKPGDLKLMQSNVLRVTRLHFLYVLAFSIATVIFDSWNLIQPEPIIERWTATAILLVATTLVWFVLRNRKPTKTILYVGVFSVIIADIILAATTVFGERGMASPAVILFTIPIITSASLLNRSAVYTTASICTAAYASSVIRYFVESGSEGFKIQLYGMLFLYISIFFIIAALISTLDKPKT